MEPFTENSEFSAGMFIVLGTESQESELPENPKELYQQLTALQDNNNATMLPGIERTSKLRRRQVKSVAGSDQDTNQQGQAGGSSSREVTPAGGGGGATQGQTSAAEGSGMSGAGAGGGGQGGGNDDKPDDAIDDQEEEDEEEEPSSSESEVPMLIKVEEKGKPGTPSSRIPEGSSAKRCPFDGLSSDTDAGGISDASTAVVSDTDGRGQVIVPKTAAHSPGRGLSTQARDVSSDASTLSSLTTSTEDEHEVTVKLRQSYDRKRAAPRKLEILSTQEMAEREVEEQESESVLGETRPDQRLTASQDYTDLPESKVEIPFVEDDDHFVATPAEHLGSLHFSGQCTYVSETVDDSDVVPPSQDYDIPMLVPSSPTADQPVSVYRSPGRGNFVKFASSPHRNKGLVGSYGRRHANGNGDDKKGDTNPDPKTEPEQTSSSSVPSGPTAQVTQWAPSMSLSAEDSGQGQSGRTSRSPDDQPTVLETGSKEEQKEEDNEQKDEEDLHVCPVHGIKQEAGEAGETSQGLVLQLSQSQGVSLHGTETPALVAAASQAIRMESQPPASPRRSQRTQKSQAESSQEQESQPFTTQHQPQQVQQQQESQPQASTLQHQPQQDTQQQPLSRQGSVPPSSSIDDPSLPASEETHMSHDKESESQSQPHFTLDRPTFEEVAEDSQRQGKVSVFKKALRQKREAKAQQLGQESSSSEDPFADRPEREQTRKRKADETDSEVEKKKVRVESEASPEAAKKSPEIMDLGPPNTLEYEHSESPDMDYTRLRQHEAESVNKSKTSTPQEAMRSLIMDSESSEEIKKDGSSDEPKKSDGESKQKTARLKRDSPISHSAPESRSTKSVRVKKRPSSVMGTRLDRADLHLDRADLRSPQLHLREIRAMRENARRRYQALHHTTTPTLVNSPQMERFMALPGPSHAGHPAQGPHEGEKIETITEVNRITTKLKRYPTGQIEVVSRTIETLSFEISEDPDGSPVSSSRSSRQSMTSGDLGDISSLSRSSGDHSSGSFSKPVATLSQQKTSPSASSSYDPARQSIDSYMRKRVSMASTVSTISDLGPDVPLHHHRTISDETIEPVATTAAQASKSSSSDGTSMAPSEALFSSPPSDRGMSRTTSTSASSFTCAQKPSKSISSESSHQGNVTSPNILSSTSHISISSTEAVLPPKQKLTRDSMESSRSRSSSGGRSISLFSETFSSHHSSESSRRSDDGLFRVPSIPIERPPAAKLKPAEEHKHQEEDEDADDTIVEEKGGEEEDEATPKAKEQTRPQGQEKQEREQQEEVQEQEAAPQRGRGRGRLRRSRNTSTARTASVGRKRKTKAALETTEKEETSVAMEGAEAEETEAAPATSSTVTKAAEEEAKGYPVYAQWRDKYFYPGHIVGEERGGRYKVRFEDDDTLQVKESDIILVELLVPGQEVFAEKQGDVNEPAVVLDHVNVNDSLGYLIKFADGSEARLERGKVIMSPEQARDLSRLSHGKADPVTPKVDVADVSLENLVDGKRKRSGASDTPVKGKRTPGRKVTPSRGVGTPGRSASKGVKSSSKDPDAAASTSTANPDSSSCTKKDSTAKKGRKGRARSPARKIAQEEESAEQFQNIQELSRIGDISEADEGSDTSKRSKRKLVVEPKATSTPTPQKRQARVTSHEVLAEPLSPLQPASPQRKTPRKTKTALFGDAVKGPIPARGSTLFSGLRFLLTHVERDEEGPSRKRMSDSNTDESSLQDEDPEVVFDKDHLTLQIKEGGGIVIDKFDFNQVNDNSFCLSDKYQRTLKYLHCLASNIQCVSHLWIHNSCTANRLLDYKAYVLPAGLSIESRTVIEQSGRESVLSGKKVVVNNENTKFQATWTEVLNSAGCTVLHKPPSKAQSKDVLVAVGDKHTPVSLVQKLGNLNIAVVSSEWVIQCLITGKMAAFDGHPRYAHDYEPSEKSL